MEADSTSQYENNINAPENVVDKYNTHLVDKLKKENEQLRRENVDLANENVDIQVKQNIAATLEETRENVDRQTRKQSRAFHRLQRDMASMSEEMETLKRRVAAKEHRTLVLEEEKSLLTYELHRTMFLYQHEVQMNAQIEAQKQQLQQRLCETETQLSQSKMQLSGKESQHQLVTKLNQDKQQALMLVGVWQDKYAGLEREMNQLKARLRVLSAVDSDDDWVCVTFNIANVVS